MTDGLPRAARHSIGEDAFALLTGLSLSSFGVYVLHSAGLVTGGTAGLSLLLAYLLRAPFGLVFAIVNAPFFVLAAFLRSRRFVVLSIACVIALALLTTIEGRLVGVLRPDPFFAAVVGNVMAGTGILVLFRHGASLGGFNIVALVLSDRFHVRAGWILLAFDCIVIGSSLLVSPWYIVLGSALGALVLNLTLVLNHRPGRYAVVAR